MMLTTDWKSSTNAQVAVAATCVTLLSYYLLKKKSNSPQPPVAFSLPVLGTLPLLGKDVPKGLLDLKEKLGDIFSIYLGSQKVVVLGNYDLVKTALLNKSYALSGRPQPNPLAVLSDQGFIASDAETNPLWTKHRKLAVSGLVEFGMGNSTVIEGKLVEEMQQVIKRIQRESSGNTPIDPCPIVEQAVSNIISSMIFGKRFDYSDTDFIDLVQKLKTAACLISDVNIATTFPWLKHLPGDLFHINLLQECGQGMKKIFIKKIREHEKHFDADNKRDIIDTFLAEQMKLKEQGREDELTDAVICCLVTELFGGGTDTIPPTLLWGIIFMIHYPEIQRKVQDEIEEVLGKQEPRIADMGRMPYTVATVNEIQRFADINPVGFLHRTLRDVNLGGYTLPHGTVVLPFFYAVHRDPKVWEKPYDFNPNHFLNADGSFKKMENLVSFSYGKRSCPGEPLARMQLFLFFSMLLQRFTFTTGKGEKKPGFEHTLGINRKSDPFKIGVVDRWETE